MQNSIDLHSERHLLSCKINPSAHEIQLQEF